MPQDIQLRKFESVSEFFRTLSALFKGPGFVDTFLHMDSLFREKVILAFSITNNCMLCVSVHSAVAARDGLTDEELEKLVALDKKDFPEREWLALNFARKTAAARGYEPQDADAERFREAFSEKEADYIRKILRMMKMANYSGNTLLGIPWRPELEPDRGRAYRASIESGFAGKARAAFEGFVAGAAVKARERFARTVSAGADACSGVFNIERLCA